MRLQTIWIVKPLQYLNYIISITSCIRSTLPPNAISSGQVNDPDIIQTCLKPDLASLEPRQWRFVRSKTDLVSLT